MRFSEISNPPRKFSKLAIIKIPKSISPPNLRLTLKHGAIPARLTTNHKYHAGRQAGWQPVSQPTNQPAPLVNRPWRYEKIKIKKWEKIWKLMKKHFFVWCRRFGHNSLLQTFIDFAFFRFPTFCYFYLPARFFSVLFFCYVRRSLTMTENKFACSPKWKIRWQKIGKKTQKETYECVTMQSHRQAGSQSATK